MGTAKQHNDKLVGLIEILPQKPSELIADYERIICPQCRAKIEDEERQKCWEDIKDTDPRHTVKWLLEYLRKKWEISK